MIANKGKVTFTIPSCIPSGQYLLRHEMIALHPAANYPGAQFYVSRSTAVNDTYILRAIACGVDGVRPARHHWRRQHPACDRQLPRCLPRN